jgi:PKHD-type hydroxylase
MILNNYMFTAPEFFTREEVAQIHQHAKGIPLDLGRTGNGQMNDPDRAPDSVDMSVAAEIRQSKVKWFLGQDPRYRMPDNIMEKINEIVAQGMDECGWNFNLSWIENFQYTIYDYEPDLPTGDFYTWHTDHGGESIMSMEGMPEHRKISMTIQLSDPLDYEGGKFQWLEPNPQFDKIKFGDKKLDIDKAVRTLPFSAQAIGSICLFPSWLYHQVTPVTRGTRVSIVGWYNGPAWT